MKTTCLILVSVLAAACSPSGRGHTMTEKDVAAAQAAKDHAIATNNPNVTWTDTEQNVQALTCIWDSGPPFHICYVYKRNAPAGAFDCTGDTYAYSGEFLFSDAQSFDNSSTNCAGYNHNSNPSGLPYLTDYNDAVAAVKNNSGVEIHGYRDANFGQNVQFFPTNGQTITNLASPYNTQMSSFRH